MRRLDLDFAPARRPSVVPWVVVAAALVLALDAASRHAELADAVDEARGGIHWRASQPAHEVIMDTGTARDFRQAEQVIGRIALPWDALFRAVEGAANDRIALLTIEPDARKGEVVLEGEAASYEAALGYIERLGDSGQLHGAHLVRHELRVDEPGRPLRFSVAARWAVAP